MTTIIELLTNEFNQEAETTRKMLSIVPNEKYDWQPHPKSMTVRRLATHIADLPSWVAMAVNDNGLDFANTDHKEPVVNDTKHLLEFFEESLAKGQAALDKIKENELDQEWILSNGGHVIAKLTRGSMIRIALSQTIHHRAQLGVFLRLLDIPIPGSYGPSADEQGLF